MNVGARCLMAYRRGEDSDDAEVGALMEAEHFAYQRVLTMIVAHALGAKLNG